MAKLYFRYSAMNSGKSIDLIKTDFNYKERNQNTLVLTSSIDNRYEVGTVSSRIGLSIPAIPINKEDNIFFIFEVENKCKKIDCVLVDEVQFFTKEQIIQLSDIVDTYDVPVIAYGLRSDFKLEPFAGSMYLLTIADEISELKTVCFCGKKATVNARFVDGEIVKNGKQVMIGGNEKYISLCRKHYKEGRIK